MPSTVGSSADRSAARRTRIGSALAATAGAAVLSGAPSTAHSVVTRRPVLATVRAAAALVRPARGGDGTAPPRPLLGDLVAGGLAHGLVSLGWGTVLARTLPPGRRAIWGAAAGLAIHALDLGVIARVVPRLAPMRALPQLPQLADHVAFGFTFGMLLDRLDPPVDPHAGIRNGRGQATSSSAAG